MTRALWNTNGRIYELLQVRRDAISEPVPDEETQRAVIAEIDKAIRTYVVAEVSENPNSIHQYLLENKARQMDLSAEIKRLDGLLAAEQGEEALARHIVTEVLHEIGEKSLPVRGTLRLQGNGGVEPVAIDECGDVEPKYQDVTVTMRGDHWTELIAEYALDSIARVIWIPNKVRIREALKRGEPVPGAKLLERGENLRVS